MQSGTMRRGAAYLLGSTFNRALLFFLSILLARQLSVDSFGALSVFQMVFLFSWTGLGLGVNAQVARIVHKTADAATGRALTGYAAAVGLGHLLLVAPIAWATVLETPQLAHVYLYLPVASLMHCAYVACLGWLRHTHRALIYVAIEISISALIFGLTVWLVGYWDRDWESRIYSMLIAYAALCVPLVYVAVRSHADFTELRSQLYGALIFGRGMVVYLIAVAAISYLDRAVISAVASTASVGVYAMLFQLSFSVLLVLESFLRAWSPTVYSRINSPSDDGSELRHAYRCFVMIGLLVSLAIAAFWYITIPWFLPDAYIEYRGLVFPLCLAHGVLCIHHGFAIFAMNEGRPGVLTRNVVFCAALQFAANWLLVPMLGIGSAAVTFLMSSVCIALGTVWHVRSRYALHLAAQQPG